MKIKVHMGVDGMGPLIINKLGNWTQNAIISKYNQIFDVNG